MSEHDDFGAFLIGFFVGGLTGAVTALLLAPQSGEQTRTVIKEKAIELSDKATETAGEVYSKTSSIASETVEKIKKTANQEEQVLQDAAQVILEEQEKPAAEETQE